MSVMNSGGISLDSVLAAFARGAGNTTGGAAPSSDMVKLEAALEASLSAMSDALDSTLAEIESQRILIARLEERVGAAAISVERDVGALCQAEEAARRAYAQVREETDRAARNAASLAAACQSWEGEFSSARLESEAALSQLRERAVSDVQAFRNEAVREIRAAQLEAEARISSACKAACATVEDAVSPDDQLNLEDLQPSESTGGSSVDAFGWDGALDEVQRLGKLRNRVVTVLVAMAVVILGLIAGFWMIEARGSDEEGSHIPPESIGNTADAFSTPLSDQVEEGGDGAADAGTTSSQLQGESSGSTRYSYLVRTEEGQELAIIETVEFDSAGKCAESLITASFETAEEAAAFVSEVRASYGENLIEAAAEGTEIEVKVDVSSIGCDARAYEEALRASVGSFTVLEAS